MVEREKEERVVVCLCVAPLHFSPPAENAFLPKQGLCKQSEHFPSMSPERLIFSIICTYWEGILEQMGDPLMRRTA